MVFAYNLGVSNALPTVSSGFAKLLATENISVHVDSSAPTAMFDVESRVLTMPVWEKMSEQLTDMLLGHEVSHALHTIDDDLLATVRKLSEDAGVPLAIAMAGLNVVEDIRIDRLIQRRYPGLRSDYAAGYPEMREMNLFEIDEDENLDERPFLDRLNLHSKAYNGEISFSAEERILVERAENTETYEEVLELTKIILQLVADQREESQEKQTVSEGEADETNEDMPSDETGDQIGENGTESEGEESEDGEGVETKGDGTMESAKEAEDDGSEAESEEGESTESSEGGAEGDGQGWEDQMPASADALSNALRDLAMNENVESQYDSPTHSTITAPKALSKYAVQPLEESRRLLTQGLPAFNLDQAASTIGDLRATATMMATAFERKQAAHVDHRTQIAKSGDLDMDQLYNYKLTDDLFLRNEVKPDGKNHAITVVIDWSASMRGKCNSTVRQAAIFAMFCQKVGVPCEVFVFQSGGGIEFECFEPGSNLKGGCRNLKILDTRVRRNLFMQDIQRMLALGACTDRGHVNGFRVGCTPLGQSVAITKFTHSQLMRETQAEIGSIIFLTDGEGDSGVEWNKAGKESTSIVDPHSRRTIVSGGRYACQTVFDWVRAETGAKIINFFMCNKREGKRVLEYRNEFDHRDAALKTWKDESWGQVGDDWATRDGWDAVFVVFDKAADDSEQEDAMGGLKDDASKVKVRNAFIKDLQSKVAARPLVERITEMIAC